MANLLTVSMYKTAVRNRLDDSSFDSSKLLQFCNDAVRDICNAERWPFMETSFTGTVAAGTSTYALPTDFQSAINFTVNDPNNNAIFMRYVPYERLDAMYPDPSALTQAPVYLWSLYGDTLTIGPSAPDQTYTLQLRYLKKPTTVDDDADTIDVPDEFSELIVLGMYKRALMTNDSFDQAQVVQQDFDFQLEAMKQRLFARQSGEPLTIPTSRSGRSNFGDPQARWY